jgi:hypothetical protein
MSAKNLHPDAIRGSLVDMSFALEPFGATADGAQSKRLIAVEQAKGRRPKPKPLQLIDFRSLVLRDRNAIVTLF